LSFVVLVEEAPVHLVRRKTAPRVVGGRAQRKNRHELTRGLVDPTRREPAIARERPGRGYRHLLAQRDVVRFVMLLPDWPALSIGLHAIVLARGRDDADGFHRDGIVAVCAWERDLVRTVTREHYDAHAEVLDRIGVPIEIEADGDVRCDFTEEAAKAYQLLHILVHELGHHHDRMTTCTKRACARGEPYAESFAREREPLLFDRYARAFGR
jgi:hypothetical protein